MSFASDVMREATLPHSIILIYHTPLSRISYRRQPIDKRIIGLDRSLDRCVIGLTKANAL
jgi:hypothetical protein